MQRWHTLVIEWYPAADKHVENNAEAPDVYLWAGVSASLEELGCCEVKTAAKRLEVPSWREEIAESKVDDLDVASLAYEDVFDL